MTTTSRNAEQDVLDDIAALVDEQLIVGEQDGYESFCRCGREWHGLAAGACPGTQIAGEAGLAESTVLSVEFMAFVRETRDAIRQRIRDGQSGSSRGRIERLDAPFLLVIDEFATLTSLLSATTE